MLVLKHAQGKQQTEVNNTESANGQSYGTAKSNRQGSPNAAVVSGSPRTRAGVDGVGAAAAAQRRQGSLTAATAAAGSPGTRVLTAMSGGAAAQYRQGRPVAAAGGGGASGSPQSGGAAMAAPAPPAAAGSGGRSRFGREALAAKKQHTASGREANPMTSAPAAAAAAAAGFMAAPASPAAAAAAIQGSVHAEYDSSPVCRKCPSSVAATTPAPAAAPANSSALVTALSPVPTSAAAAAAAAAAAQRCADSLLPPFPHKEVSAGLLGVHLLTPWLLAALVPQHPPHSAEAAAAAAALLPAAGSRQPVTMRVQLRQAQQQRQGGVDTPQPAAAAAAAHFVDDVIEDPLGGLLDVEVWSQLRRNTAATAAAGASSAQAIPSQLADRYRQQQGTPAAAAVKTKHGASQAAPPLSEQQQQQERQVLVKSEPDLPLAGEHSLPAYAAAAAAQLWVLLSDHLQALDALLDQQEAAMALLGQARGPDRPDAQAGPDRLGVFELHYKKVQTWVVRRNVSKAQQAVVRMLQAVLHGC
ncbi:hypothetical protein COO60DRAFT_1661970 [Scenedesmus sp. NREL 46B-D3]|nr:hypothetical protein COO60DRAFT_1661970 [Scenedesmus sp. NREL 46B-D3]